MTAHPQILVQDPDAGGLQGLLGTLASIYSHHPIAQICQILQRRWDGKEDTLQGVWDPPGHFGEWQGKAGSSGSLGQQCHVLGKVTVL